MSSQYLPFEVLEKYKNGKSKKKPSKYLAKIQVREIKMYEIVYPKECEDVVMGMIKPTTPGGFAGFWGKPIRLFARLLGLKKCSTTWKPNILPNIDGLSIMALGTKDDKMNWEKEKKVDVFDIGTPKEML